MTAHRHPLWQGSPWQYQRRAAIVLENETRRVVLPWSWITPTCGRDMCLAPECMKVHEPHVIAYPRGLCTYCGEPAGTKDHLLPEPLTGMALRGRVAVVPACADCNSRIADSGSYSVAERRRVAQLSIERRHRHLLASPHKTPDDLAELGPAMRSVAVTNNHKRAWVKSRLAWPLDPLYDLRAFQRSGIEDPVALGLCDAYATPLRPEYAAAEIEELGA